MVYQKFLVPIAILSLGTTSIGLAGTNKAFTRYTVDDSASKPAFIKISDLDGDGKPEILVSMFGRSPITNGSVALYKGGQDLGSWEKKTIEGSKTKFPNSITIADVNQDGKKDIILPSGFLPCIFPFGNCGSLRWFAQQEDGSFKYNKLLSGQKRFYHHVEFVDFDQDGIKDIVAVGEEKGMRSDGSSVLQYFKGNDSELRFETKPTNITPGLGSFPRVLDLDNDGDWEVFSSEYFGSKGSFSWIDQDAQGEWQRYYIDSTVGKSIQISFVEDLFGKGRLWAIGSNHTNTTDDKKNPESAIYVYEVPDFNKTGFNPKAEWKKLKASEGIISKKSPLVGPSGAPGVFAVGDVDGDGDKDIVVSGDGDPRIFWLRQDANQKFTTVVIADEMPQGGVDVADLDGDGTMEVVASSWDKNKVFIYKFNK